MRQQSNLPMLTGDPVIDILYLSGECNSGIQFACTFLAPLREQMEQKLQQQQPTDSEQDELGKLERIQRMQQNDAARQAQRDRQEALNAKQQEIRDHNIERMFR
ncbi:MAG: hypothetical protein NTZ13_03055 [Candidatus Parcubacteria bacterium]|nr:hypothetical protein [Candidatus Parcubacteria bacterium]